MFAEEIGAGRNSARRKAEDNRARRQRLKAMQEKKKADAQAAASASAAAVQAIQTNTNTNNTNNNTNTTTTTTAAAVSTTNKTSSAITPTTTTTTNTPAVSFPKPTTTTTIPFSSSSSLEPLSAVERAKQERQIRAQQATQTKAIIQLQSWMRSTITRQQLRQQYTTQLTRQLDDLQTLASILKAKGGKVLNPPITTTTNLVRQFIWLINNNKNNKNKNTPMTVVQLSLLQQIIELTLLPGFQEDNDNNNNNHHNTCAQWLMIVMTDNYYGGYYRFKQLLECVSLATIHPQTNTGEQLDTFLLFLTKCLTTTSTSSSYKQLQETSQTILFATTTNSTKDILYPAPLTTNKDTFVSFVRFTPELPLDWLALVRYYLLFGQQQQQQHTSDRSSSIRSSISIIPKEAETKRDACISQSEKLRGSKLVLFLLQHGSTHHHAAAAAAKLVRYILTIPLLTWRLAASNNSNNTDGGNPKKTTTTNALSYLVSVQSTTTQPQPQSTTTSTTTTTQQQQQLPYFLYLLQSFVHEYQNEWNQMSSSTNNNMNTKDNNNTTLFPTTDVPMTLCPATPMQCFMANLVQLGRLCPTLTPTTTTTTNSTTVFSYSATSLYMDILSSVVDLVPLGTLTSQSESVVEWISVGGSGSSQYQPIVVSSIILEHCKAMLVDSYIRRMFQMATTNNTTNTTTTVMKDDLERVLNTKTDKDMKYENELHQASTTSATSLAAKEARMDRNKSFWNSSKWARKLSKGVSNLLSSTTSTSTTTTSTNNNHNEGVTANHEKNPAMLLNTTSVSRELAQGGKSLTTSTTSTTTTTSASSDAFTLDLLLSLCRFYSIVLARWGGTGNHDLVLNHHNNRKSSEDKDKMMMAATTSKMATSRAEPFTLSLLNVLCFSTPIVRIAWALIQQQQQQQDPKNQQHQQQHYNNKYSILSDVYAIIDSDKGKLPVRAQRIRPQFVTTTIQDDRKSPSHRTTTISLKNRNDGGVLLYIFLCTFAHVLIITDDVEIHDMDKPLPLHQIRRCILVLKKLLYRAACVDTSQALTTGLLSSSFANYFGLSLIAMSSKTMRDLYDRSSRKPFCLPNMWTVSNLMDKELGKCKTCSDYTNLLASMPVLRVCPFLVSFKRRLKLFERIITTNRIEIQGENSANPFHNNPLRQGIPIRITRGRILEDGLATMNNLGSGRLRERLQVQYYNEAGVRETGIDAGGLFKDFWTDMCAIAFNPDYALFRITEAGAAGNFLYPNPSSSAAHGPADHIVLFEFLGRILGKALYEGITISPQFAHFFLSFMRGDYNFLHMLPDLSTVDPQLYNNLMFLKNYDGDCSDLCLTFTVTNNAFGGTKEIPLIPNGANVEVTNENKQRYIGLVAKYYVFDRVREQSEAFTRGLWDVLDRSWLQLFNEPELQVLISGVAEGKLDVDDMKAHVQYVGGYTSLDRTIVRFWNVVSNLTTKQQADLLRFVTGCERPPPLGFGSMNPPFTIQRVGTGGGLLRGDGDRLPTASTCFNVLKLPSYGSEKVLKERLIYAIESGAGFELT